MVNSPNVSVIIPTYNRAHSVNKAIDSVLAQSFKDFEIVVVDDGSVDNTAAVLAKFGDRITVIRQQNSGVSAARNAGIRAACGKWIAFLDSDDIWFPGKLARQVDCLSQSRAKICFTRCVADNNELIPDIDELKPAGANKEIYFESGVEMIWRARNHPQVQSMIVDKDLLQKAGMFDESLYAAEDTRLIYNLAFLSGFAYIEEPLVMIFRWSSHSLTYDLKPEAARRRYSSYLRVQSEAYWQLLEQLPEKSHILRDRFAYFLSRRAELACAAAQPRLARLIARNGISLGADLKTFMRCLGIYLAPTLFQARFQKKWYGGGIANANVAKN
jgi:glycosyltransferase involved in cell wall biosynthesis